jgi:hypothetical protein
VAHKNDKSRVEVTCLDCGESLGEMTIAEAVRTKHEGCKNKREGMPAIKLEPSKERKARVSRS